MNGFFHLTPVKSQRGTEVLSPTTYDELYPASYHLSELETESRPHQANYSPIEYLDGSL